MVSEANHVEPCERCDGRGRIAQRVTRDMAIDAGDIEMEGQEITTSDCEFCRGTGSRLVCGEESGLVCEPCGGRGDVMAVGYADDTPEPYPTKCSRCLGTGVQP